MQCLVPDVGVLVFDSLQKITDLGKSDVGRNAGDAVFMRWCRTSAKAANHDQGEAIADVLSAIGTLCVSRFLFGDVFDQISGIVTIV